MGKLENFVTVGSIRPFRPRSREVRELNRYITMLLESIPLSRILPRLKKALYTAHLRQIGLDQIVVSAAIYRI